MKNDFETFFSCQVLNILFRECGGESFKTLDALIDAYGDRLSLQSFLLYDRLSQVHSFVLISLDQDRHLLALTEKTTDMGYHWYQFPCFKFDKHSRNAEHLMILQPVQSLKELLLLTLSIDKPVLESQLSQSVHHNIENLQRYWDFSQSHLLSDSQQEHLSLFIRAEQSLWSGHPFHFCPKMCLGFSATDQIKYSPELGAEFYLGYVAVHRDLVHRHGTFPGENWSSDARYDHLVSAFSKSTESLGGSDQEPIQHYDLLPIHPWQKAYLQDSRLVKQWKAQGKWVDLGQGYQPVYPTSSIRTLWSPNEGFFYKCPMHVKITNFVRYNPAVEIQRALTASRIIESLPEFFWKQKNQFEILLESAYIGLKPRPSYPNLDADTNVVLRSAVSETLDNAQVVATLLQSDIKGEHPGLKAIFSSVALSEQSDIDSDLVDRWWQKYLQLFLIPCSRLLLETGVSVEAHLQNVLLVCDKAGWPKKIILRDMEGVSVDASWFTQHYPKLVDALSLEPDHPVFYPCEEAWSRFSYYVFVNHIGHFAGCLARSGFISEALLWQRVDETLDHLVFRRSKDWVQFLRQSSTLPVKLNLKSQIAHTGHKPFWGSLDNPIQKAHSQRRKQYSSMGMISQLLSSQSTLRPQHPQYYAVAQQRVIQQLLEALLFEKAIEPDNPLYNPLSNQWMPTKVKLSSGWDLAFDARLSESYGRVRISSQGVYLERNGEQKTIDQIQDILDGIILKVQADQSRWFNFCQELQRTLLNHSQSLTHDREWLFAGGESIESCVLSGHTYHPTFKSRVGFSLSDNAEFGPEFGRPFSPVLVAVHHDICHGQHSQCLSTTDFLKALFSEDQQQLWQSVLQQEGVAEENYLPLLVHPWQWHKHLEYACQEWLVKKYLVVISSYDGLYRAQQSIRTLTNVSHPEKCYVKLAMSLVNTSTSRVLAPHTVQNAAPMSDWLSSLVDSDEYFLETKKPIVLKEFAGYGVTLPGGEEGDSPLYGAMAMICRESLYKHLGVEKDRVWPVTALFAKDRQGQPVIKPWLLQHGIERWVKALLQEVYLPVLHLLWGQGVALESHAQNMSVVLDDSFPVGVVLRDFHDGVRFCPDWIHPSQKSGYQALTEAPETHRRINPNSFVQTQDLTDLRDFMYDALGFVNLSEVFWILEESCYLPEKQCWLWFAEMILNYQKAHPQWQERFDAFDVFAPQVGIEKLACRRFQSADAESMMSAPNPLYHAIKSDEVLSQMLMCHQSEHQGEEVVDHEH